MDNYAYKQLAVWQKAMRLVMLVYEKLKDFPDEERFALTDQLRRSVVSIPSNIAEGNGRASNRDYAHFLSIARGSLYETMTQLEIAQFLGYVSHSEEIENLSTEIRRMLSSMIQRFAPYSKQEENSTVNLNLQPQP